MSTRTQQDIQDAIARNKGILREKGYSQRRAAAALGVSYTHLKYVLMGVRVSSRLLEAIAALPTSQTPYQPSGFARTHSGQKSTRLLLAGMSPLHEARALLRRKGYTHASAAAALGDVARQTVSDCLRGTTANPALLERLAALPMRSLTRAAAAPAAAPSFTQNQNQTTETV